MLMLGLEARALHMLVKQHSTNWAAPPAPLNSYIKKNNLAWWLKHHSTMSNFLCNRSKLTSDQETWVSNITLNLIIFIVSIFGITAWWLGTLIFHYSNELRSPLKLSLFKENSESLKEHFNNSAGDLKLLNCGRNPAGGRQITEVGTISP